MHLMWQGSSRSEGLLVTQWPPGCCRSHSEGLGISYSVAPWLPPAAAGRSCATQRASTASTA